MKRFGRPCLKKFSRDEKIHFCINIGIGIAVVVLLQFFKNTNFGEHAHNKAFDYIIAKEAAEAAASGNIVIQKTKRVAERVAFVDRGKTYKKRGSPLITPRDELAKVIEVANKGKAKVIVLDILLEDKDCCHPEHETFDRDVVKPAGSLLGFNPLPLK